MSSKSKKIILLLLPDGTTIRNFLTTDIIKYILDDSDCDIVCALNNPERYSSLLKDPRVSYVEFHRKKRWTISSFLLLILRSRFCSINKNKSLDILSKSTPFYRLLNILSHPFPQSKLIYNCLCRLQYFLYVSLKEISRQFEEIKPDLVLSTHLIKRDEYDYLMLAKSKNIPNLGMVKSFDNITGKGYFACKPDSVIVWNEVMEKELIDLYGYNKNNIIISGVPQFDIYKEKPKITRSEFFENIGLDSNKKTILYATNSEIFGVDDCFNIKLIQSNLSDWDAQLIVRIHFDDNLERYLEKDFENVYFQVPGIEEGNSSQERVAHRNFIMQLRDTLYFSDVTINTASTMTLDAIACAKPVINIYFDWKKRPYLKSVKRFYDLLHYAPIVRFNKKNMAHSKEELLVLIKRLLGSPNLNQEGRKNLEDLMLSGNTGDASRKIAMTIVDNIS